MFKVLRCGLRIDDDIIQVDVCGFPFCPRQYNVDGSLEGGRGILQTEQHAEETVQHAVRRELSLVAVLLGDSCLPILAATIQRGKDSSFAERIDALVHPQQ